MTSKYDPENVSRRLIGYPVVMILSVLLLAPLVAQGETRYVQPSCEVMLRRGQGTEFKILEVLSDGAKVELLEETELWARVRSEGGREGWLPKRFLTDIQPAKNRLDELEKQRGLLEEQNRELQQQVAVLQEQQTALEEQLHLCVQERDKAVHDYSGLKDKAASIEKVMAERKELQEEVSRLRSQVTTLENDNGALRKSSSLRWFLAGSGVLLVGWLLGLASGKGRRRKSSLL